MMNIPLKNHLKNPLVDEENVTNISVNPDNKENIKKAGMGIILFFMAKGMVWVALLVLGLKIY